MFKSIIATLIRQLDYILQELKRAYDETYRNDDLLAEFRERVEQIKEKNKNAFIRIAENVEFIKSLACFEGFNRKDIKRRARERWKEAYLKGDLDELYNIRKEQHE